MFAGKRNYCPLPLSGKNGEVIPVETRVWFGKWNGKECIFGISKDISKEQETLQMFNKIFNNNPALIAISELPGRQFFEVNEIFLEKMGYSQEEILGKTAGELGLFVDTEKQYEVADKLKKYWENIGC